LRELAEFNTHRTDTLPDAERAVGKVAVLF